MSWIVEYDTQCREFPTCVHVTKTTGTMTHGVTYVPIEDGKAVRAENAKLRELVSVLICFEFHALTVCEHCPIVCDPSRSCRLPEWALGRARELGVEVGS